MHSVPPSARPPSGSRTHPMAPPGVPLRGSHAKSSITQPCPPAEPQRMSMPPAAKTVYPAQSPRQSTLNRSGASSRPSPALSSGSAGESLRESTRANMMPPSRQWSEDSVRSPREPFITTPKEQYVSQIQVRDHVEMQFEQLLDSLQVPASVRQKFSTVSAEVKTSLVSSQSLHSSLLNHLGLPDTTCKENTPKMKKRKSTPLMRRARSSSSLDSPGPNPEVGKTYKVEGDAFTIVASPLSSPNLELSPAFRQSFDLSRPPMPARMSTGPGRPLSMSLFGPSSSSASIPSFGKQGGKGLGIALGEQPDAFIRWLGMCKGTDLRMEVDRCKKLRMLLRHENTGWVTSFIELGGYKLVLARLKDILDVEWREEQHDDQMLYELLRCIKALSTSEVGKNVLRAEFPAPFDALSTLLFSEKKPGDLACRQLIIELWLILFEIFPPSLNRPSGSRPSSVRFDHNQLAGPSRHPIDIVSAVRGLLIPDIPNPMKEQHQFITQAHRPRVFKAWVGEMSDICRDYFWIVCHAGNTLWAVDEVDERLVEKPVAPGGATGGVEFEAMNYVTMHFKLLNALCKYTAWCDRKRACELHQDLFLSGMDRILVTFRKASTTYYPTLHLELARYVAHLRAASPKGRLPPLIEKMVGSPPEGVRKQGVMPINARVGMGIASTDGGRTGGFQMQC